MPRSIIALFVTAVLSFFIPQVGMASNGATVTVNPELRQAIVFLDSGQRVTINAASEVFTFRASNGQSVSFTFAQIASEMTGIPSERQALIQQWRTRIGDPTNKLTITNTLEPTLSLASDAGHLPPGSVMIQGAPGIGGAYLSDPMDQAVNTQSMGIGAPNHCTFSTQCACNVGDCWNTYGSLFGMGMMYFALDGNSARERATKDRQKCLAQHFENWRIRQQSNCASVSGNGVTAAIAVGITVALCATVPNSMSAAAKPCLIAAATAIGAMVNFSASHRACRAMYPGAGRACD